MRELKGHVYHGKRKFRCPLCLRVKMQKPKKRRTASVKDSLVKAVAFCFIEQNGAFLQCHHLRGSSLDRKGCVPKRVTRGLFNLFQAIESKGYTFVCENVGTSTAFDFINSVV
jgi:hypothetical protein